MYIENARGVGDVYKYGEVTITVIWMSCLRMKAFTLRTPVRRDIVAKIISIQLLIWGLFH